MAKIWISNPGGSPYNEVNVEVLSVASSSAAKDYLDANYPAANFPEGANARVNGAKYWEFVGTTGSSTSYSPVVYQTGFTVNGFCPGASFVEGFLPSANNYPVDSYAHVNVFDNQNFINCGFYWFRVRQYVFDFTVLLESGEIYLGATKLSDYTMPAGSFFDNGYEAGIRNSNLSGSIKVISNKLSGLFVRTNARKSGNFVDVGTNEISTNLNIDSNQVSVIRPNRIIRPIARYILLSGTTSITTSFVNTFRFNQNDSLTPNVIIVLQGGGGAGGFSSSSGGGGAGATRIIRTNISSWTTIGAGAAGQPTITGNGNAGSPSYLEFVIPGITSEYVSANGGAGNNGSSGGAGGIVNTFSSLAFDVFSINGSSGGSSNSSGVNSGAISSSIGDYLGSRLIEIEDLFSNDNFFKLFMTQGATTGAISNPSYLNNGALDAHTGGTGGISVSGTNFYGGGGGASKYSNGAPGYRPQYTSLTNTTNPWLGNGGGAGGQFIAGGVPNPFQGIPGGQGFLIIFK
jgi:hypothetical protein